MTRADLIKQADTIPLPDQILIALGGMRDTMRLSDVLAVQRFATALRALAGDEWVEVTRLDREDG